MDASTIASALTGAQAGQTQMAIAVKMMKMNAEAATSIAELVDTAAQSANSLANVASGIGGNLDITV
jgi:hypothetical protein